jgi:hypothetical protein
MQSDLRTLLPIATRVVLYTIPESSAPSTIREIKNFANDRGAIRYILSSYLDDGTLEDALLQYWNNRTYDDSFRVEETLAAILLALALPVVANAIYDIGKSTKPEIQN